MFYPVKRRNNVGYADPFQHIFDQFFGDAGRANGCVSDRAPGFEIAETDEHYTVIADLPGLGKENVSVSVDDNVLTVRGAADKAEDQKAEGYSYTQKHYETFERKFKLPDAVKQEDISASYVNGVLNITLPKQPEPPRPEPRQISINS